MAGTSTAAKLLSGSARAAATVFKVNGLIGMSDRGPRCIYVHVKNHDHI